MKTLKDIESLRNPEIQALRALQRPRERRAAGLFLAEGVKMTEEAVDAGLARTVLVLRGEEERYAALLERAEAGGARVLRVTPGVLEAVGEAKTPQPLLCAAAVPEAPAEPEGARLLALDGVQDPGNVGTMIRTADAAGFGGVLLGEGCADPWGPKAVRATMGSLLRLPPVQCRPLTEALIRLRDRGYALVSSELGGGDFYEGCPDGPVVLVVGSEGNGVSPEVRGCCTHRLALPMRGGAESLNAAVAAGIMMYEIARRSKGAESHA